MSSWNKETFNLISKEEKHWERWSLEPIVAVQSDWVGDSEAKKEDSKKVWGLVHYITSKFEPVLYTVVNSVVLCSY